MIHDKSVIKSIQRGVVAENVLDSTFIEIDINPVNPEKTIVIFNCLNYSSTNVPNATAIAELVNGDTLRIFGNYITSYGMIIPKCSWQIIEFN